MFPFQGGHISGLDQGYVPTEFRAEQKTELGELVSYMPGDLFAKKPFLCPMPQFPPSSSTLVLWCGAFLHLVLPGLGDAQLNLACILHCVRGKEGEPFGMDHALPDSLEG